MIVSGQIYQALQDELLDSFGNQSVTEGVAVLWPCSEEKLIILQLKLCIVPIHTLLGKITYFPIVIFYRLRVWRPLTGGYFVIVPIICYQACATGITTYPAP